MAADAKSPAVNRYFGAPFTRNEDPALLTGQALFVDDVVLAVMWHAALLRSPHAHARIEAIDTSAAKARDGVIAVYTAEDLGDFWQSVPLVVPPPPIPDSVFNKHTQVPLAKDKVRYAGEPVALVVAETEAEAHAAARAVIVDVDVEEPVITIDEAIARGSFHTEPHTISRGDLDLIRS